MEDLIGFLCGLTCVLSVVAVVGHFLWLIAANVLAALSGKPATAAGAAGGHDAAGSTCYLCGGARDAAGQCEVCGWPQPLPAYAKQRRGLTALRDHVARFERAGVLSPEGAQALRATMLAEIERLDQAHFASEPARVVVAQLVTPASQPMPAAPIPVRAPEPAAPEPAAPVTVSQVRADMADRVARFAARQAEPVAEEVAKEAAEESFELVPIPGPRPLTPDPQPPAPPRRPISHLFAAFLEERNIRWGELVGGLLIVASSIALVISFWHEIARQPSLKFFVFNGVTAGLFGLAWYIHKHWKLETTSAGLLSTATLLVPLNFLAISALVTAGDSGPLFIAGEILSTALFAGLVLMAARILTPTAPWATTVAVIGASVGQFIARRALGDSADTGPLLVAAAIPTLAYGLGATWGLAKLHRAEPFNEAAANEKFRLMGLTSFAAAVGWAFIAFRAREAGGEAGLWDAFRFLAPFLAASGLPGLASGLVSWKRSTAADLASHRTAGTFVGLMGAGLMLVSIGLGWPDPLRMAGAAGVCFVTLTIAAWVFRESYVHAGAALVLAIAYTLCVPAVTGQVPWLWAAGEKAGGEKLVESLLAPSLGVSLLPLVLTLGGVAGGLAWRQRREAAIAYGALAGVVWVISLGAACLGFGRVDDGGALWLYAMYAVAALAAARATARQELGWTGGFLVLMTIAQALNFRFRAELAFIERPWLTTFTLHCMLLTTIVVASSRACQTTLETILRPLTLLALRSAAVAGLFIAAALFGPEGNNPVVQWQPWALAAACFTLAVARGRAYLFSAGQGAMILAMAALVAGVFRGADWLVLPRDWLDLRIAAPLGAALAATSLGWITLRWAAARGEWGERWNLRSLVAPDYEAVDAVLDILSTAALLLVTTFTMLPALGAELSTKPLAVGLQPLFAWAVWVWWGLLLAAMLARAKVEQSRIPLQIAAGLVWLGTLLVAGMAPGAAATAWTWSLVGLLALGAGTWLAVQKYAPEWLATLQLDGVDDHVRRTRITTLVGMALIATAGPVFVISAIRAVALLPGGRLAAPADDTWFAALGQPLAYGLPLAACIAPFAYAGYRLRTSGFAFMGGLTLALLVAVEFGLAGGMMSSPTAWVSFFQFESIAASAFALVWLGVLHRRYGEHFKTRVFGEPGIRLQMALAVVTTLAFLLPAMFQLYNSPSPSPLRNAAANVWGCLAVVLALATAALGSRTRKEDPLAWAVLAAAACGLIGMSAAPWDIWKGGNCSWLALHVWLAATATMAFAALALAVNLPQEKGRAAALTSAFTAAICLSFLAARVVIGPDPLRPWAVLAAMTCVVACWTLLAPIARSTPGLYLAAAALQISAMLAYGEWGDHARPRDLFVWNVFILALPVPLWLWIERRFLTPKHALSHLAALLGVLGGLIMAWQGLAADWFGAFSHSAGTADALALAAIGGALFARWWAARRDGAPVDNLGTGLFVLGLAAMASVVDRFDLDRSLLIWLGTILLAAYAVTVSYILARRALYPIAGRTEGEPPAQQLVYLNLLLSAAVLALSFVAVITLETPAMRLTSGKAALLQTLTFWLLARADRKRGLEWPTLLIGLVGLTAWSWGWIDPAMEHVWLHRAAAACAASTGMLVLLQLAFPRLLKLDSVWRQAADDVTPAVAGVNLLTTLGLISVELTAASAGQTPPLEPWALWTVAGSLLTMGAAALVQALKPLTPPPDDPTADRAAHAAWELSQRETYVYVAEGFVALTVFHLRLAAPWLFEGFFTQFWPLIVVALSFLGVGLSEYFRQTSKTVFVRPLERTGALLPILPALSFWFAQYPVHYSGVLLTVGALYTVLAVLRQSFGYSLLAALAANGALWYFLGQQPGWAFWEHPQLWLIPPALCVLAAEYLNRDKLNEEQRTMIRYGMLSTIYVSSTADIVLIGVSEAPWLPVVLAALSLVGIFVGMMARVRAFLFLGTGFLGVALFTVIWHAAVDLHQTWIWSVTGIAAGIAIIAVFALFEKRRDDVLRMVEGLRQWEA